MMLIGGLHIIINSSNKNAVVNIFIAVGKSDRLVLVVGVLMWLCCCMIDGGGGGYMLW